MVQREKKFRDTLYKLGVLDDLNKNDHSISVLCRKTVIFLKQNYNFKVPDHWHGEFDKELYKFLALQNLKNV